MSKRQILLADDEKDILEILEYTFTKEGYKVHTASDGLETLMKAEKYKPDIILLDIMMPKMDGIDVCRTLRGDTRYADTLILMLTARNEEYSEIAGFDAGADDYVTKPIRLRSLVKRLSALDRRNQKESNEIIEIPPFQIDRTQYLVIKGEEQIKLPRKEFELLLLLAKNKNKVVTRQKIYHNIWGTDVVVVDRTIDVHIRRIRKKIGDQYIQTVKGVGYKFQTESEAPE